MGTLYACCRSLKMDSFWSLSVTNPRAFSCRGKRQANRTTSAFPGSRTSRYDTKHLASKVVCQRGGTAPLVTPGLVRVWPQSAFPCPWLHPSKTQRSGADQPTSRADLRRIFTRTAGRDERKRVGEKPPALTPAGKRQTSPHGGKKE